MSKTPSYRELILALELASSYILDWYPSPLIKEQAEDTAFKLGYVIGLLRMLQEDEAHMDAEVERSGYK